MDSYDKGRPTHDRHLLNESRNASTLTEAKEYLRQMVIDLKYPGFHDDHIVQYDDDRLFFAIKIDPDTPILRTESYVRVRIVENNWED
jgi:hypothetical protein